MGGLEYRRHKDTLHSDRFCLVQVVEPTLRPATHDHHGRDELVHDEWAQSWRVRARFVAGVRNNVTEPSPSLWD